MKTRTNNIKSIIFSFFFTILLTVYSFVNYTRAICKDNVVIDPLDPNCDATKPISIGNLINRFIQLLPFVIFLLAVFAIVRAAIKIISAGGDSDKRNEGFKGLANAGIGLVLFFSIWAIIFFISQFVGRDILPN